MPPKLEPFCTGVGGACLFGYNDIQSSESTIGAQGPQKIKEKPYAGWSLRPTLPAVCYALPMNKPQLIVMSGLPGSGKSTIAERLAERLKLPVFSVDPIESAIIKAGIQRSFETSVAAYQVAETLASEQLKIGNSVIIDAVNAEEDGKDVWRGLARRHGLELIVLLVIVSDRALHKQRIESRVRGLHGFSEVTWERVEAREKVFTAWKEPTLQLDSARALETVVEKAIRYISAQ